MYKLLFYQDLLITGMDLTILGKSRGERERACAGGGVKRAGEYKGNKARLTFHNYNKAS